MTQEVGAEPGGKATWWARRGSIFPHACSHDRCMNPNSWRSFTLLSHPAYTCVWWSESISILQCDALPLFRSHLNCVRAERACEKHILLFMSMTLPARRQASCCFLSLKAFNSARELLRMRLLFTRELLSSPSIIPVVCKWGVCVMPQPEDPCCFPLKRWGLLTPPESGLRSF